MLQNNSLSFDGTPFQHQTVLNDLETLRNALFQELVKELTLNKILFENSLNKSSPSDSTHSVDSP